MQENIICVKYSWCAAFFSFKEEKDSLRKLYNLNRKGKVFFPKNKIIN